MDLNLIVNIYIYIYVYVYLYLFLFIYLFSDTGPLGALSHVPRRPIDQADVLSSKPGVSLRALSRDFRNGP